MRVVETSLKFPAETFDKDLENPFSPKFQQVKNSAEKTVNVNIFTFVHDPVINLYFGLCCNILAFTIESFHRKGSIRNMFYCEIFFIR